MPFFRDFGVFRKLHLKKEKNATLQVRIPSHRCMCPGRRVLPSASLVIKKKASLTVEAALVLSLFIFGMVTLMAPMKMMNSQRMIQAELESICEDISQYAYIYDCMSRGDQDAVPSGEWDHEYTKYFAEMGAGAYAFAKMKSRVDSRIAGNLSFMNSKILEDGETVDLVMDYQLKLPFPVFHIKSLSMTARSCRRGWIGRDGRDGAGGGNGGRDSDDEIVYVGRDSSRFHRSKTCHYLYNDLKAVTYSGVGTLRNSSGNRYRPCSRCGKGVGGMVYVTPNGSHYHGDRGCSAIVAYVRSVPLSEVAYLGPCSYCSR